MTYPRLVLALVLGLGMFASRAGAAELYGTVYTGGAPAANLTFAVKGRDGRVRTDTKGQYSIDLPPGDYVLIIRGQSVPVTVKPERTRRDVRL